MSGSLAPLVSSKAKLRVAAKGLTSQEIAKLIDALSTLASERKKKEQAKEVASKKSKITKIKALMDEAGLSPSDLKQAKAKRVRAKVKTKKVAPKYRLVIDGTEHLWSGRGRAPKAFKDYFDKGNSKESCAI